MFDNAVNVLSMYLVLSPLPQFDFDITDEKMVKVIEYYQHAVCSPVMKAKGNKMDYFLAGVLVPVAGLWHGNGDALHLWHSKTLAAFKDIDGGLVFTASAPIPEGGVNGLVKGAIGGFFAFFLAA